MEVAMPMAGNAIDCYEDMFKEITRKLYGEDGLPELGNADRLPTSQDRGLTPVDYDMETHLLKPEEHITAFGLAALIQNGFPSTGILNPTFQQHKPNQTNFEDKWIISEDNLQWTQSKVASYNPAQKLFRCAECDCVGYLPRVAEHWLGTHSNLRVFQCPQCPYESAWARCVRMHLTRQHNVNTEDTTEALLKNNPVLYEVTRYLQRLKSRLENNCSKAQTSTQVAEDFENANVLTNMNARPVTTQSVPTEPASTASNKRYSCSFCPYATDRRDLFTRHENIHREEKPFQCYVCQKQFNRADHVKKHFLRMHREHPYDLNRIRRHPPKNASGMSYYHKYNANGSTTQVTETNSELSAMNSGLSIPNNFGNLARSTNQMRVNENQDMKITNNIKPNALSKNSGKKKGDKRFTCCYCSWSGVDNWCLKRHMNTHLKPFVCSLCDYKAARSERLATHVLKVHNKRACSKCSFLADDPAQLVAHQQEHHPLDQRSNRLSGNTLRSTTFNNTPSTATSSFGQGQTSLKPYEITAAAALLQHGNRLLQPDSKPWKPHAPKQHGAARLFNYMEASDGSEPEGDSRSAEDMSRITLNHRIQSDFPEAGDVGSNLDEEEGEEIELPLFICQTCGCEFEDDSSLETHQYAHRHSTTSPAKAEDSKENLNPELKYLCRLCEAAFPSQFSIMDHMSVHSTLSYKTVSNAQDGQNKRSRKQSQPKKVVVPFWNSDRLNHSVVNMQLYEKYMAHIIMRKGYSCNFCRSSRLSRYVTKGSLILHQYWRHSVKNRFQCEHCSARFNHRYQVILHSSRVHIRKQRDKSHKTQVVPTKEPIHPAVPVSEETHNFLTNSLATTVPDIINTSTTVHKLGVSKDRRTK